MSMDPLARSGAVTGVGVAYLVLGGLTLVLGLVIMIGGAAMASWFLGAAQQGINQVANDPNATPEQKRQAEEASKAMQSGGTGFIAMVAGIIGVCFIIFGVPALLGGIGVIQRKGWGRVLTLIMAFVYVIFGGLGLVGGGFATPVSLIWCLVEIGIGIYGLVVLFNSNYAAEFRRATV